mmetsp:Transcript_24901/g.41004  ORF Transcript_24901/g.41004 Transcript_24901/m.41004 type:complete len:548 (-) Transcript_24901:759-2402(-)
MEETLDEKPSSLIRELISQLRVGMDLSKVVLPVFVLEPRSLLEKLSDFLSHAHLLIHAGEIADPVQRMIAVVRWYMSGWHLRPRGVKKPYNPILGEVFRCMYDHGDEGGVTSFVAEQVSHHPPMSAFYVENRLKRMIFSGSILPRSKFLGNSVASLMEGESTLRLLELGEDYVMNWPNYYARGLIIGRLLMEIGGSVTIRCRKTNLCCNLDFRTKGFFTGEYNRVKGSIKDEESGNQLYTIEGYWDSTIRITNYQTGETSVLFEPKEANAIPKVVPPEDAQEEYESRRLWSKVTEAIAARDLEAATAAKTVLEEAQRREAKLRAERKEKPHHRLFHLDDDGIWQYNNYNDSPYSPSEASSIGLVQLPKPIPPSPSAPNGLVDDHAPPTVRNDEDASESSGRGSPEEEFAQPPAHEVDPELLRESKGLVPSKPNDQSTLSVPLADIVPPKPNDQSSTTPLSTITPLEPKDQSSTLDSHIALPKPDEQSLIASPLSDTLPPKQNDQPSAPHSDIILTPEPNNLSSSTVPPSDTAPPKPNDLLSSVSLSS